jgi:hypothetical protein
VNTQGNSGGKVNILGGNNIGHCEENVYMNMCLIRIDYQDKAILNTRPKYVRFLFVSLSEDLILQMKTGSLKN